MPRVSPPPVPTITSPSKIFELNDYSKGINSYVANDVVKDEFLEIAQNARIPTLGEYETRKGVDFHSEAVGLTQDQSITSTTGAADQSFDEVNRLAQKFTAGTSGRCSKIAINIKNDSSATGTPIIELWTNDGGSPGTMLARSSISASTPTDTYGYQIARFVSAPVLTSSSVYWIVVYVQASGTESYKWSSTTSASTALTSSDSGVTWSSAAFALNFKQYYATDSPSKGVYRAYKSDGTAVTLLAAGTTLYKVSDVDGTLTSIKTGLSASATQYRFATVNDTVYYVNEFDGYRKWDFSSESQVSTTNYSDIIEHKGLMFLNETDDRNKWVFSNFADYETFTSTDFIYVPSPKTGDPSVAAASVNGALVIWTRRSKFILYGSDNSTFDLEEAPGKKGTFNQNTVVTDRSSAYFLSDDGIYGFDGTTDKLISQNNYADIRDLPNKDTAVLGLNKGRLYVYYSLSSDSFNSRCWVYNLNFEAVESFDTNSFVNGFVTAVNDDNKILVSSSLIGQAYWQELDDNDYTNLGGDIDFYLQTHHMIFGSASREKEIRYWKPRFGTQSGDYTIEAQYGYDLRDSLTTESSPEIQGNGSIWGDPNTIWGSFIWGTTAELQSDLSVPGQYRRIKFAYKHFATRQPNRFLGHTFVVQLRRLR